MDTAKEYLDVIGACRQLFYLKTKDYGTAWRVLRTISIVDQLFIKVMRIRTIQETGVQKVADDVKGEFVGIVNYSIMGLIQLDKGNALIEEIPVERAIILYDQQAAIAKEVMENKNHDYGEAWRDMSLEGITDLILVKVLRMRQILANHGSTEVSEGIDANYTDIINYAVFCLIKMQS
jgi:hypothetical protein